MPEERNDSRRRGVHTSGRDRRMLNSTCPHRDRVEVEGWLDRWSSWAHVGWWIREKRQEETWNIIYSASRDEIYRLRDLISTCYPATGNALLKAQYAFLVLFAQSIA